MFESEHNQINMSKQTSYTMTEKVVLWSGDMAAWHFVAITKSVGQEVKQKFQKNHRGFGSIPVTVTVGKTTWQTSIFPDKYSGSYLLPLKAAVRKKEDIEAGEMLTYTIVI